MKAPPGRAAVLGGATSGEAAPTQKKNLLFKRGLRQRPPEPNSPSEGETKDK